MTSFVSAILREMINEGCSFLKSPMSLGRRYSPGMVLAPKDSSPRIPRENSLRAFNRPFRKDKIFEAYSWKTFPDFVSRTSRLARSKRRSDRDRSNERMWPLTVGWVRKRSSAALEKLLKSATRQKVSRCRNSICNGFLSTTDKILMPFLGNCKKTFSFQNLLRSVFPKDWPFDCRKQ